jgi:AcrR family transcriptional regulator
MTTSQNTKAATGRPRDDAARRAILTATAELLDEIGFDKLSIEGIAGRAGVAKTTIYRWWHNKGVLAIEAFLMSVSPKIAFSETAQPIDDLRSQVHKVAKLYRGRTGRILCELIALGQADAKTQQLLLDGYILPRRNAAKICLQRAVAQGFLRADLDLDTLVDAIYGPIWYRMVTKIGPIDNSYVEELLDITLQGATPARGR